MGGPAESSAVASAQAPAPSSSRPKVTLSVMRAALAAAGVPTVGLLERAEFEALYWNLQEGGVGGAGGVGTSSSATAAPSPSTMSPTGAAEITAKVAVEWEAAAHRAEVERCAKEKISPRHTAAKLKLAPRQWTPPPSPPTSPCPPPLN